MPCRTLLRLAAFLSLLTPLPVPAQTAARVPAAHAAGYHWHTLVLQHAVPSDILALMHWNGPVAPPRPVPGAPPADLTPHRGNLPVGVLRIFALQSNNSLLVDATEEGFATVTRLVKALDTAPRQVQFKTLLVAVPATRAGLDAPDTDAARFLTELLRGEQRMIGMPTVTTTDGTSVTIPFSYGPAPLSPLGGQPWFVRAEPTPDGSGPSTRRELRLTPQINADGTLTLRLTFGDLPVSSARTLRSGELAVYDVTSPSESHGERLFFFLRLTVLGDSSAADGGSSVTVTP